MAQSRLFQPLPFVFPAYCRLLTAFCSSVLIFVFVFVVIIFLDDVQFNRIEAHDLQLNSTLFAFDHLAFVRVSIDMDFGFAFRTRSGRHLVYLQTKRISRLPAR